MLKIFLRYDVTGVSAPGFWLSMGVKIDGDWLLAYFGKKRIF